MIELAGIGPQRQKALAAAGVLTLEDVLFRFPGDFHDFSQTVDICALQPGMKAAFEGEVMAVPRRHFARGLSVVSVRVADGTGEITCCWYNQPYIAAKAMQGSRWLFFGAVEAYKGILRISNPSMDELGAQVGMLPVYAPIKGVPPKLYRELVLNALEARLPHVQDAMPLEFCQRFALIPLKTALREAHFPRDEAALVQARRRLAFEELLLYQILLMGQRPQDEAGVVIDCALDDLSPLLQSFPYELTGAQRRVLGDMLQDMRAQKCMARLVQGDVGSGKTALAMLGLYAAHLRGYQGALMAPTEVLARQHMQEARQLLEPLGMKVELLVGSLTAKERKLARARVEAGEADAVVGTHALITREVRYARLGLVITDEQHRFGVRQRSLLQEKGEALRPNMLVMSATPIPRTLALILYGDLDISLLDEMPPGRLPIKTHVIPEGKRAGMYGFLREQMAAGGQVYVVCPLVEESETMDEVSAQEKHQEMKALFPEYAIGWVHGRMTAREKGEALQNFSANLTQMLVSTTVIEVGVNVPNANVMVVEGADRFGLAQLHQLRGRVGRGTRASYCFLMGEGKKLRMMAATSDGFLIAQKDLEMRGPGALLGHRQSGLLDARLASLAGDTALLEQAHRAAAQALARKGEEAMQRLIEQAHRRYGDALETAGFH